MNNHANNENQPAPVDGPPAANSRPHGPPASSKSKPPSQRNRNANRSNNFRQNQGKSYTDNVIKKDVNAALFMGFEDMQEVLDTMSKTKTTNPKYLPVTTRGIGFSTYVTYASIQRNVRNTPPTSVYSLYRVSLAQMAKRLESAASGHVGVVPGTPRVEILHPDISLEISRTVESCAFNFNVISSAIRMFGDFTFSGEEYRAYLPRSGIDPLSVTFGNLRDTVVALANCRTDPEMRKRFYDLNPLPGAIWRVQGRSHSQGRRRRADDEDDPNFPVLTNPEDFMPAIYTRHDFRNDCDSVAELFSYCQKKALKLARETGYIKYSEPANHGCLMSNVATGRIPDPIIGRNDGVDAIIWNRCRPLEIELDEFWAPTTAMDAGVGMFGAIALVGELHTSDSATIRSRRNGSMTLSCDYADTLSAMIR